jgi:alpha-L-arabinofuranosidase
MSRISRRALLNGVPAAGVGLLLAPRSGAFQVRRRRVVVAANAAIGAIRPELHGHFAEHLGNCIYNGLWVGRGSSIPNINGHRRLAVEYLKALGIPVLRWPGGCFADDYHWRDGIGPVASRPRRVNIWWGQYTEDNSFGIHEFVELCRLIGAEPYVAGNVGSGTPQELRDWVEYSNFPSGSTLADERARNGSPEPFRIRYWGVGNENWGCGGKMTPDEYATHFRRFGNYLTPRGGLGGTKAYLVACGPNRNDVEWSRHFLTGMGRFLNMVDGFAMHFYQNGKSEATKFTAETAREQLAMFHETEKAVVQQHALLRSFDPEGRIGLLMDEWGVWDRMAPEDEKRHGRLWQQITMRSAVAAAMGLNIFHRQADKLVMGNIAQTVNVLHSLLLTEGERCVRTSTYYAFEMMKAQRGQTSVRVENEDAESPGLSVSASRAGGNLVLTLTNPRTSEAAEVECAIQGATARQASARILHHADLNACNTFERPDTIVPRPHTAEVSGGSVRVHMPPLSVVSVAVNLG